jgi:hypothetical protein
MNLSKKWLQIYSFNPLYSKNYSDKKAITIQKYEDEKQYSDYNKEYDK